MGQAGTGIEGLDDVLGGGFGSMRTCSRACCIPPTWSSARRRSASLRRSRRRSRSGWCSTAFRSQAARAELSAVPGTDPQSEALFRHHGRDRSPARRPHRRAERQDGPLDRARRGPPGRNRSRIRFGAAQAAWHQVPRTAVATGGLQCFPGSSPPSTRRATRERFSGRRTANSTPCSAAVSSAARAFSFWDRRERVSRFLRSPSSRAPRSGASAPRCSSSTRSWDFCWNARGA